MAIGRIRAQPSRCRLQYGAAHRAGIGGNAEIDVAILADDVVAEIDLHEHNFDKLGFPPDHPATDMQDSFYISRQGAVTAASVGTDVVDKLLVFLLVGVVLRGLPERMRVVGRGS